MWLFAHLPSSYFTLNLNLFQPMLSLTFILLIKFIVKLIKSTSMHITTLCAAKAIPYWSFFTQGSIHLHWRLLGSICGYLGNSQRKQLKQWGKAGWAKQEQRDEKNWKERQDAGGEVNSGRVKERDKISALMERHNDDHRWKSLH